MLTNSDDSSTILPDWSSSPALTTGQGSRPWDLSPAMLCPLACHGQTPACLPELGSGATV